MSFFNKLKDCYEKWRDNEYIGNQRSRLTDCYNLFEKATKFKPINVAPLRIRSDKEQYSELLPLLDLHDFVLKKYGVELTELRREKVKSTDSDPINKKKSGIPVNNAVAAILPCNFCGKNDFSSSNQRNKHKRTHHDYKMPPNDK